MRDITEQEKQEFERLFAEWMESDELARQSFEEHPERKELYRKKWFDSLGDRDIQHIQHTQHTRSSERR